MSDIERLMWGIAGVTFALWNLGMWWIHECELRQHSQQADDGHYERRKHRKR